MYERRCFIRFKVTTQDLDLLEFARLNDVDIVKLFDVSALCMSNESLYEIMKTLWRAARDER